MSISGSVKMDAGAVVIAFVVVVVEDQVEI